MASSNINMQEFISNSELETKQIAYNLASKLYKGNIVVLSRRFRRWQNKIY